MSVLKVNEIQTTTGVKVMTSEMKVNPASTSSGITVDTDENAIICGPFSGTDIEVNGNLTVTQGLTFSANLTIATGKTVQVI